MASSFNRISSATFKNLTAAGKYPDGGGLYLVIGTNGSRHWFFRYRHGGRRTDMGLGSLPTVTMALARSTAEVARRELVAGKDPMVERDRRKRQRFAEGSRPSFGEFADALIMDLEPSWKTGSSTAKGWRRSIEFHAKSIRKLPVDEVITDDILAILRPIWNKRNASARATRVRLAYVLDAAKAARLIAPPWENPAKWDGHLSMLLSSKKPAVKHQVALPYAEMPAFYAELGQRQASSAVAFQFLILTCVRKNEALGARWSEISLAKKVWLIPKERMKAGREHRVALSDAAITLLEKMPRHNPTDLVFSWKADGKPFGLTTFRSLLQSICPGRGVTVHGMRSSFRDWLGEETEHLGELGEIALAHRSGSAVERAYRRGDMLEKRFALMNDWADFCTDLVEEEREAA